MTLTPAKRVRGKIFLACFNLRSQSWDLPEPVLDGSAAIELIHEGTLLHDDVVDGSLIRRGNPSFGAIHGIHAACHKGANLVGAGIQILMQICSPLPPGCNCMALLEQLAEGQILESLPPAPSFATQRARSLQIMDGKTGALFAFSAFMGIAASQDFSNFFIAPIEKFARAFGRAYQIRDDILDIEFCHEKRRGRPEDIYKGTISWPALLWLGMQPDWHDSLRYYFSACGDAEKAEGLRLRLLDSAAIAAAHKDLQRHIDQAAVNLAELPTSVGRTMLRELTEFLQL
jgi:geranylgeranyl pyrophosphate synthase